MGLLLLRHISSSLSTKIKYGITHAVHPVIHYSVVIVACRPYVMERLRMVELYLHSLIHFHGVALN
jgi:hypothetical protein